MHASDVTPPLNLCISLIDTIDPLRALPGVSCGVRTRSSLYHNTMPLLKLLLCTCLYMSVTSQRVILL
jgi:hypothetical protein